MLKVFAELISVAGHTICKLFCGVTEVFISLPSKREENETGLRESKIQNRSNGDQFDIWNL